MRKHAPGRCEDAAAYARGSIIGLSSNSKLDARVDLPKDFTQEMHMIRFALRKAYFGHCAKNGPWRGKSGSR